MVFSGYYEKELDTWAERVAKSAALHNQPSGCIWKQDWEGNWASGCGRRFVFIDATPSENGFRFCPFCGGGLTEEVYSEAGSA